MPTIRPYTPADKPALLNLFRLNTPRYFHESEVPLLANYLEEQVEDFFVVEGNGIILGSGGVNYEGEQGCLSWCIIHPEFHGKGIGRLLTEHRLKLLKSRPEIKRIIVRTSQHTYGFHLKMGFKIDYTKENFFGNGFDLYFMKIEV